MFQKYVLIITLLSLLLGCKKRTNDIPQISLSAPANLSNHAYGNALNVKGSVSDRNEIKQIKVELLKSDLQSTTVQNAKQLNELNPNFNVILDLDDIHLESGKYFIKVTAFDGEGFGSEYLEINYQGAPKTRKGLCGLFEDAGIFSIDSLSLSNGSWGNILVSSDSILDMEVQSYDQYLIWSANSKLHGKALKNIDPSWDKSGAFDFPEYDFQHLRMTDAVENLLLSRSDGNIQLINSAGGTLQTLPPFQTGYKVKSFIKSDNKFYAILKHYSTGDRKIVHYSSLGIVQQNYSQQMDVLALFALSNSELLLIGNENNQAKMKVHYTGAGGFYEPYNFGTQKVLDAVALNTQSYIILMNGGLYRYTYTNNNLLQLNGNSYKGIAYDQVNNVIAAFTDYQIDFLDVNGQLIQSFTSSKKLYQLKFWFNK